MGKTPARVTGIDVSAKWLDVSVQDEGSEPRQARFDNTDRGHRQLCRWLGKGGRRARVVLEATGVYSLDLALALERAPRIAVMVVNPRVAKDYANATQRRAHTDRTAAAVLRELAPRMPFTAWQPPRPAGVELRALGRRIEALRLEQPAEKNRLHAAESSTQTPAAVRNDIAVNIRHLERRVARLIEQALALIAKDAQLARAHHQVSSIKGIADLSAIRLLGELLVLPADMSVRQWVAHAGLDPRPWQSGSSVARPTRISRVGNARIRGALYLPALVAIQREPHVRAFRDHLVARGKTCLQANVAVMRKLLHAIYGMLKTDTAFVGQKFFKLVTSEA